MTYRVEFKLSMPVAASHNGKWSGEGRHYAVIERLSSEKCKSLGIGPAGQSWSYRFTDGWVAKIRARIMAPGERKRKSEPFPEVWMVRSILKLGQIVCPGEECPEEQ